jgi:hypothetical protein
MRSIAVALVAFAAAAAPAGAQTATTEGAQDLFTRMIREDPATSRTVRAALEKGAAFVAPDVGFADLTGDGKQDAIAVVETGGAAGAVALYVFSIDGAKDGKLRAIYRSQKLYRVLIRTDAATLLVRTPVYQPGDDVCCPPQMLERTLTWSKSAQRLVLRSTRRFSVM